MIQWRQSLSAKDKLKPKQKKCKSCDSMFTPFNSMTKACSVECAMKIGRKVAERKAKERERVERRVNKLRKKQVMSRQEWYGKLQRLVNQYIRITKAGKPCPTCGAMQNGAKWDAGHFIPQKGHDARRFMLINIEPQCVNCNQYNSGRRAEFREWMIAEHGLEKVEWLECDSNHQSLKEQFPSWEDIEKEILRYRKLIRGEGFNPIV